MGMSFIHHFHSSQIAQDGRRLGSRVHDEDDLDAAVPRRAQHQSLAHQGIDVVLSRVVAQQLSVGAVGCRQPAAEARVRDRMAAAVDLVQESLPPRVGASPGEIEGLEVLRSRQIFPLAQQQARIGDAAGRETLGRDAGCAAGRLTDGERLAAGAEREAPPPPPPRPPRA